MEVSKTTELAPPAPMPGINIKTIWLVELHESPLNPRKHFDAVKLDELAASIKSVGRVVQPIVARPAGSKAKTPFEIVCGARRWRAAKKAGLQAVACDVQELDDRQVIEIMTIENGQREDIHPLEEADGYALLIDKFPEYTPARIAERVGKDISLIYKRLSLLRLIAKLREDYLAGKFTLGHALSLARLEAADQQLVLKQELYQRNQVHRDGKWVTVVDAIDLHDLDSWIHQNVFMVLSSAPWQKDDATLVPAAGACIVCPKRTGANLALFEDVGAKRDCCLDRKCFASKLEAFMNRRITEAATDGVALLKVYDTHGSVPAGVLNRLHWNEATSGCAIVESALVVGGREGELGHTIKICRGKKCVQHNRGYKAPPKSAREIWDDKRNQLDRKLELEYKFAVLEEVKTAAAGLRISESIAPLLQDLIITIAEACHGDQDTLTVALGIGDAGYIVRDEKIAAAVRKLEGGQLAQIAAIAAYDPEFHSGKFEGSTLFAAASRLKVKLGPIHKRITDPQVKKFEAERAAAMAKARKSKKKAPKRAKGKK